MKRIESGSSERLCYEEAAGSTGIGSVFLGIIGAAIGAFLTYAKTDGEWYWMAIPLGLGGIFVLKGLLSMAYRVHLIGLLMELPGKWIHTTIEADREGVRIRRRGLVHRSEVAIPVGDIREVEGWSVVTRDQHVSFRTVDTTPAELEWIRAALRTALAS